MSILRYKQKIMFADGGVLRDSGGGGGSSSPQPVQQNVNNTQIPDYARPYVERMLGQAQAVTDINQNPYQPYAGQRVAGFTPMQAQAFQSIANQQVAPQLSQATTLANQAGAGSGQIAGQAVNAGQNYANMATNPYAMQAYMNPYVQASLQPQLNLLAQQGGIQSAAQQGAATQVGAFGGSRSALANALAQQNNLMAQQQAIGQGYNQAYQQAQQAQQFGAGLGLQGLQTGLQGYGQQSQAASTLGALGQTQYGQEAGINQARYTAGAAQQGLRQQELTNQYQDYLNQLNYPYQQLGFMSNILRGLPLGQQSTAVYQAAPSSVSQLAGLGAAGAGLYGLTRKKGGAIKEGSGLADIQLHKLVG